MNRKMATCVSARFSSLPELLGLISYGLNSVNADPHQKIKLRASLAVEELFANSIHHGYGKESDAKVYLTVELDALSMRIIYEDTAAAFDPFASEREILPTSGVGDLRVGGLGCLLVKEVAQHHVYRREAGRNIVILEFDLTLSD